MDSTDYKGARKCETDSNTQIDMKGAVQALPKKKKIARGGQIPQVFMVPHYPYKL